MNIPYHERLFRFTIGDRSCTILSDGYVVSGDPRLTHPNADPEEMERLLERNALPADRLDFAANILLLSHDDGLVMFEAGLGSMADVPAWGKGAGQLARSLAQARIDPKDVRHIVLSHGHSEHIGGLVRPDGTASFPNAQVHISRLEFDFWTDPDRTGPGWRFDHDCAIKALLKQKDRITFIEPDRELVSGIKPLRTPGHTIDHLAFVIDIGRHRFYHLGDAVRHFIINVQRPTWEFIGDADRAQTVKSRLALLETLDAERATFLSYHFPWPGLGRIERRNGTFIYRPYVSLDTASYRRC